MNKQEQITVLGAGSWGSMLAYILDHNGYKVKMWSIEKDQVEEFNSKHTNSKYVKDFTYPESIVAYNDMDEALEGADDVLFVVPAQVTRTTAKNANKYLEAHDMKPNIMDASKGIEKDTYKLLSEILTEEINPENRNSLGVISGPTQAESVAKQDITLVTFASDDQEYAKHVQALFSNSFFRMYTNKDVIGTETAGAMKNIIAIGAGALYSLGYEDNATAALMTRGLAEIARLGASFGANQTSFSGLAGFGDLIVTATSSNSRNWRAGYQLGKGESLKDIEANMGMVIEGVATTTAAYDLAKKQGIDMPITSAIYNVLNNDASVKDEIAKLMKRSPKPEFDQDRSDK